MADLSSAPSTLKTSANGNFWTVHEVVATESQRLQSELGCSQLVAEVLVRRGYSDPVQADRFLNPKLTDLHSPKLLPDYRKAVDSILGARERKEQIFVHGDYDADGVTSTALFTRFLRAIQCEVAPHVPHRLTEGYGIHASSVERAKNLGTKLFLTCDCGTSAFDSINTATEHGMRVVVTDHHELQNRLPNAYAVINPHRPDSQYPFNGLCGAGVVFKLCSGIADELGMGLDSFYRAFLDLAAIATVGDAVPLVDENRIIVSHGLARISESRKKGIQALLSHTKGEWVAGRGLKESDLSYQLVPRLNAPGRIGHPETALNLLLSNDDDEAFRLAREVNEINSTRKGETLEAVESAVSIVERENLLEMNSIVVWDQSWHQGLVGLIAGDLVSRYGKPTVVLNVREGVAKGSARTVAGFHLANSFMRLRPFLLSGGGHAMAAGCSVLESNLLAFREAFSADVAEHGSDDLAYPTWALDGELTLNDHNLQIVQELNALAPFGVDNREPKFLVCGLEVRKVIPTKSPAHVRLEVSNSDGRAMTAMGFGLGEMLVGLEPQTKVDLVVTVAENTFNGRTDPQWSIKDYRRSD